MTLPFIFKPVLILGSYSSERLVNNSCCSYLPDLLPIFNGFFQTFLEEKATVTWSEEV